MRIWISGAQGYIGKHVCSQAAAAGHEVWALTRPASSRESSFPGEMPSRIVELDLSSRQDVEQLVKQGAPDAVIHLAWYVGPRDYLVSPQNDASLETSRSFFTSLSQLGSPRVVGVGTCLEYADLPSARVETDVCEPRSPYAQAKHSARLALEALNAGRENGWAWARLFHIHGGGEHQRRLVPAVANALRAGRVFELSPGLQVRDHLEVRDVAAALVHIATNQVQGIVNVCSGVPVTLKQVLTTLAEEIGRPDLLHFGARPYADGEVMFLAGDPSLIRATGWKPVHADLRASLRASLASTAQPPVGPS